MIYVPMTTQNAIDLSRNLFLVAYPNATNSVTQQYFNVVTHPSNGMSVIAIPETMSIPVNVAANTQLIADVLAPFVAGGQILQIELDMIMESLESAKGDTILPAQLIPTSWQPYILSESQAEAEGYFNV